MLSVTAVIALSIAATWPQLKRVSAASLWYVSAAIGWDQGMQFSGTLGDVDAAAGSGAAVGGHCSASK
jgi:hypothetical protein